MRYYSRLLQLRSSAVLAALISLLAAGSPLSATTIRVPADQPTIQAALNVANAGDIVLVAPGTYSGAGNRNLDFQGKDIILRSEAGAQTTIIDCSAADRAFHFHSGESDQAVVEGFTIQNAYTLSEGGAFLIVAASPSVSDCVIRASEAESIGGAAYCWASATSFIRCTVSDNRSNFVGGLYFENSTPRLVECTIERNGGLNACGGIALFGAVTAAIEDCVINSNGAGLQGGSGGGMVVFRSNVTLARCSFGGNGACVGGAIHASEATMLITDSVFLDNRAIDSIGPTATGGAIASQQCSMTIQRCEFRNNVVSCSGDESVYGGAVSSGDLSLVIANCRFQENAVQSCNSPGAGGALFLFGNGEVNDCVFFRNSAPDGSAIQSGFSGSNQLTIARCTLANNSATTGGTIQLLGAALLRAQQTIIAFNTAGEAVHCEDQSSAALSCCDVFGNAGGDWTGCIAGQQQQKGNLALDPLFCDLANGLLTLDASSPCAPRNTGDCGLIGALPVDCGVQAVTPTTWGQIKGAYSGR